MKFPSFVFLTILIFLQSSLKRQLQFILNKYALFLRVHNIQYIIHSVLFYVTLFSYNSFIVKFAIQEKRGNH